MKVSSTGQKIWAKLIGGLSASSSGHTISESGDSSGAIYVGGYTNAFGVMNDSDALIIKLNANGDLEWIKRAGRFGENKCKRISS